MKRLVASSVMLFSAAAALYIGGTGAFFSDQETSSGNTFTAGAIDLKIDNESYYNGALNQNTSWSLDDLGSTIHKFFDFDDIKPGDVGEDTISLHVNTNDAYLCAEVKLTSDEENSNTQPEIDDGDTTTGPGQGELADAVNFLWWADDGDNVLEDNETVLPGGPLGALAVGQSAFVTLADSTSNIWNPAQAPGPIPGNTTKYLGKAWCFGAITAAPLPQDGLGADSTRTPANSSGGVSCSGVNVNDVSQTDSLTADVSFSAVQSRNNTAFTCPTGDCPITTQNILVPGAGFETPEVTDAAQWDIFPSGSGGWNVAWRSDVPATFGAANRPAIANLEYHEGVVGLASEGDQYIELDSDWNGHTGTLDGEPASTIISQTINTVPGQTYEIHYAFAARPGTPASDNTVEVRWGGVVVDTAPPTAGAPGPIVWSQRSATVTATTTSTTLSFGDLGTANSLGSFVDDMRLYTQSCTPTDVRQ
jgi:predicted ribosomally synthesized peptide with SipW-like signal peptide